jgi:hypothetical protein
MPVNATGKKDLQILLCPLIRAMRLLSATKMAISVRIRVMLTSYFRFLDLDIRAERALRFSTDSSNPFSLVCYK